MNTNGNEAAYPLVQPDPHGAYPYVSAGLTKREAFAMAAMQGILAGQNGWPEASTYAEIARRSVLQADDVLCALAAMEPQP